MTLPQRSQLRRPVCARRSNRKGVPDYRNDGTDDAASFAHRAGDHHDGIQYFGLGPNGKYSPHSSERGLLCMNHEAITPAFLHPAGPTIVGDVRTAPEEVLKEFYVHGVSIIEIVKQKDRKRSSWSSAYAFFNFNHRRTTEWDYEQHSRFNRRIHTLTRSSSRDRRRARRSWSRSSRPTARETRGTVNNCAQGFDAVGHVPDLRRELGRLLPPHRGD